MIHKVCNLMPLEKITLNHLLYFACPSATFTIFAIFSPTRVKNDICGLKNVFNNKLYCLVWIHIVWNSAEAWKPNFSICTVTVALGHNHASFFQCIGHKNYYKSLYEVKISLHTRYDIGVDKKYDLYHVQHHLTKVMAVYKRAIS